MSLLIDCSTHVILSYLVSRGPSPDMNDLPELLGRLPEGVSIKTLLADAGFDSQWNHEYLREEHGIVSIIPPTIGRPTKKKLRGSYRALMKKRWKRYERTYGQRWQVESVNSMMKRNLGDELMGKSEASRKRELGLLAITHNLMI